MRALNSAEIHPNSWPTTAVYANRLGPGSPKDPFTYLHTSPLGQGNSCFRCRIQILGCRHKSSFQNCCGRSHALGKLWDRHIHPTLMSGNENPDQGRWGIEDRILQKGNPLYMFLIDGRQYYCFPIPMFPFLLHFPGSEMCPGRITYGQECVRKRVAK